MRNRTIGRQYACHIVAQQEKSRDVSFCGGVNTVLAKIKKSRKVKTYEKEANLKLSQIQHGMKTCLHLLRSRCSFLNYF